MNEFAENLSARQHTRKAVVQSRRGVVAAQHGEAAQVGAQILADGGNAVDAAVGVSFALGAVEPWMSGIGGGGLMVVRRPDGESRVVDFGMRAPGALDPADYPLVPGAAEDLFAWPAVAGDRNLTGATALAVPGTVDGMGLAHRTYGRLEWPDLVAPAVDLARRGVRVDWYATLLIGHASSGLARFPASVARFLPGGYPPPVPNAPSAQAFLPAPALAETLSTLMGEGPRALYDGPLAESLVADVGSQGGCLGSDDLRSYRARLLDPLCIDYRGARIFAAPEFSAGPTLADTLARMAGGTRASAPDGEFFLACADALAAAYRRRLETMGDVSGARSPECTSHFAIVDRDGMFVSCTQTLLSVFGSMLVLPSSGVLMNNGLFWFDPRPGRPNSLGASKRCLSNMCPVVVELPDGRCAALGASGGRRIMPSVAQVVSFLAEFGMDLEQALHHPRIDASGAAVVLADNDLPDEAIERLRARHEVIARKRTVFPAWFANVTAVCRRGETNLGGSEPQLPWSDAREQPG